MSYQRPDELQAAANDVTLRFIAQDILTGEDHALRRWLRLCNPEISFAVSRPHVIVGTLVPDADELRGSVSPRTGVVAHRGRPGDPPKAGLGVARRRVARRVRAPSGAQVNPLTEGLLRSGMRGLGQHSEYVGDRVELTALLSGSGEHRAPEPECAVADGEDGGAHPAASGIAEQVGPGLGELAVAASQRDDLPYSRRLGDYGQHRVIPSRPALAVIAHAWDSPR